MKGVVITLDELLSQLTADHKIQKQIEEPLSLNFFKAGVGASKSTSGVNSQFVFFQILIDYILRLKSTQTDKDELINLFQNEYEGNRIELANIDEFKRDYSSEKVLWWYTRESFFSKTLNGALSMKNIHMIFLFRSFISDIYRQLRKHQSKNVLKVYRSQIMSKEELTILNQYIGQFISINSFFSTNTDYKKARSYLDSFGTSCNLERVLFQIDADPKTVTSKVFADISEFTDGSEVLFMVGSIFRIENINCDDDQISIIRMTLCNDDEQTLKQVLLLMKQQFGSSREITLETLGKILCKMGNFDLAEKYFNRLLNELALDDPLRANLYEDLAELASLKEDYGMMVEWHQKSLEIKNEYHLTGNLDDYGMSNSLAKSMEKQNSAVRINTNTKWIQNAVTIAGGNGQGNQLNQLSCPCGVYIDDDDQCIYISEWINHRIVEWKCNAKNGQIVVGKNGQGSQFDQLSKPTDVIVDKNSDSFIICDHGNNRVLRLSRQNTNDRETIISDVHCFGLVINNKGDLYVSDWKKNEVRRWKIGETNGTLVAGGNGQGNRLDQLNCPTYIFVDDNDSVYVSDCDNNRVMKWMKGAREGIVVAGGQGEGNSLTQLSDPQGLAVDHFGNIYVADSSNYRIMCWSQGSKQGTIVVGGNGQGQKSNQFSGLRGLSFDRQRNLYVVDCDNNRVQKFNIDLN